MLEYLNGYYIKEWTVLTILTLLPVAVTAVLYAWNGRSLLRRKHPLLMQILCGVIFGGIAVMNTEYGMNIGGAIVNVRDAAPICAGFAFGPVSGIIAGVIGAVERWFSAYWTFSEYSRVACSIATAFSGVYAAFLRKYFFDGRRPHWQLGFITGAVMEILHMTLIFLTHLDDPSVAADVVRGCTVPMTLLNALAVMGAMLSADLIDRRGSDKSLAAGRGKRKHISQQVQSRLFITVIVAFFISMSCFFLIQNNTVMGNAEFSLRQGIYSLNFDISDESDEAALRLARAVAVQLDREPETDLGELCGRYDVADIYVVDENGIIVNTSGDYLGFDMRKDSDLPVWEQQSGAFMALLEADGPEELVQPLQPLAADPGIERKMAGVRLNDGGFVQIALDEKAVLKELADQVRLLSFNRVIGENGYLFVTDEELHIISSEDYYNGRLLTDFLPGIDVRAAEDRMVRIDRDGTDCYVMTQNAESFVTVAILPARDVRAQRDAAVYLNLFLQILVYASLFLVMYLLLRHAVVEKIGQVNTGLESIIGGDLDTVVNVRSSEEFALLSDDINATVKTLKNYIAEAAGRIDRELAFARQIQQAALPSVFPPYPERKDFSLYAVMDAAKEVGGDFYDFFFTGEDKLAVLIADVSGKGIPAAMFMMNAKSIIKGLAESGMAVNDIFTAANERICANNEAEMFVTAWMGIIDLKTGHVSFANAGHNPPYIVRNGAGVTALRSRAGFVLGGMAGIRYREQSFDLAPGERLFLYTDGVTEAADPGEELFGEKRLEQALSAYRQLTAEELLPRLREDVAAYAGEAEQADDITMLVFDYYGMPAELTVPADGEHTDEVRMFLEQLLEQADATPKATTQLLIATDEIVCNISRYAYPEKAGTLTVTARTEGELFKVKFTDNGVPFDPLTQPEPDITLSAEERSVGGLGIYIVKKIMDVAAYARVEERNELTLYKNIRH